MNVITQIRVLKFQWYQQLTLRRLASADEHEMKYAWIIRNDSSPLVSLNSFRCGQPLAPRLILNCVDIHVNSTKNTSRKPEKIGQSGLNSTKVMRSDQVKFVYFAQVMNLPLPVYEEKVTKLHCTPKVPWSLAVYMVHVNSELLLCRWDK
jgi:hypothetical protein